MGSLDVTEGLEVGGAGGWAGYLGLANINNCFFFAAWLLGAAKHAKN